MNIVRVAFRVSFILRNASGVVKLLGPAVRAKKSEDSIKINIPFQIEAEWTSIGSSRHPMGSKNAPYGDAEIGFRWNEDKPGFDLEHNYVLEDMPTITIDSIDGYSITNQGRKLLEEAGLNDLVMAEVFSEKTLQETDKLPLKSVKDWLF